MRARAAAAMLLALAVVAALGPTGTAAAGAQQPPAPNRGRMTFVAQTPWVGTGGNFLLRVRVDRPTGASNLEFALTIFPAVATRSEFGETLSDRMSDSALIALQPVPLAGLRPEPNGDVVIET